MSSTRVLLNVGGSKFDLDRDLLQDHPGDRLSRMVRELERERDLEKKQDGAVLAPELTIDRPADCFAAVLAFYQTGELHMPLSVCPGAFKTELVYWRLDETRLASCCSFRYNAFFDEQATLKDFKSKALDVDVAIAASAVATSTTKLGRTRARVWSIVDNREATVVAKIYFLVALAMVFLAIFALSFSTDPAFQRKLTTCEMIEYLESTGSHAEAETIKARSKVDCSSGLAGLSTATDYWDKLFEEFFEATGSDYYDAYSFFDDSDSNGTDYYYYYYAYDNASSTTTKSPRKVFKVPKLRVPMQLFGVCEYITLVFFCIDLILRLGSCPSMLRYFVSIVNVVDIIALAAAFAHIVIVNVQKEQKYQTNWLDVLEYFQILRVLRLFRVVKNVRASKVLVYSVRSNVKDITILALFLLIGVCTFASLVFAAEPKSQFKSIPEAWWWALITMTTVGYGDLYPTTAPGRVVGAMCAISGVILLALTLPIFVNNFVTLYQYAIVEQTTAEKLQKTLKKTNTAVTKLMAATVAVDTMNPYPVEEKMSDAKPVVTCHPHAVADGDNDNDTADKGDNRVGNGDTENRF